MYITVKLLKKHKACKEQVDLFAATFPNGAHVTEAACLAVADQFDFRWAADNLLPRKSKAEYKAQRALVRAEYHTKNAPILAWYHTRRAPLCAEYDGQLARIWAEYKAKLAALFGRIASTVED